MGGDAEIVLAKERISTFNNPKGKKGHLEGWNFDWSSPRFNPSTLFRLKLLILVNDSQNPFKSNELDQSDSWPKSFNEKSRPPPHIQLIVNLKY